MPKSKPNILLVYGSLDYPIRTSIKDLIYAFHENTDCNAFIYGIDQGSFPEYLKKVNFDLIVFSTILVGERWLGEQNMKSNVYKKIDYLRNLNVTKVVHPQDEWIHTYLLNDFINDFNISYVFTVAPETEWKKIYNKVDFNKVQFHKVLTGYLSNQTVNRAKQITASLKNQSVDIGYRAYKSPPWLGSHGYLKTLIAEVFYKEASKYHLKTDISTEEKDTILGDAWLEFMASCKYFIGVEGGSTVIDPDGEIFKKGSEYQKQNPNASFEMFEQHCFAGMNGNLGLIAISPRHLEACITKTCQVLIEGEYNGVLKPHIHYIEVKKDFSNLEQVFELMKDDKLRISIVNRAYQDIVESGHYSYLNYTKFIIEKSLATKKLHQPSINNWLQLKRNRISDKRFWNLKKRQAAY